MRKRKSKHKSASNKGKNRNLTNTKKKVVKLMLMSLIGGMPLGAKATGEVKGKSKRGEKKAVVSRAGKTKEGFTYYDPAKALYDSLQDESLNFAAFKLAFDGWQKLRRENPEVNQQLFTVIDFSLPSDKDRFYVIDAINRKVLHKSVVAHGKNSGVKYAKKFSNVRHSNMSSLGFFLTGETYFGKHGLSIRLDGLEEKINHNARQRAVVIHNADYASRDFVKRYGRLGRSFGCPALPKEGYEEVVEWISDKSVLFIYHPTEDYFENSVFGKDFLGAR